MGTNVEEICQYLKTRSINIPPNNNWLTSCVECFQDQGTYSIKELKELVLQQWLLADLSDIGFQVLPNNCLTAEKLTLQGRYAVQLNYFVNVALSFHKQLQRIRRPDVLKNLEVDSDTQANTNKEVSTGNRILKIEITDGVLTVIGFEDHFIRSIQEPFVPGKKAILIGPIECRKGILFLKPCNIQILGGEVDAFHIPNATENILARALKMPENPDPYRLHANKEEVANSLKVDSNSGFDDDDEAMMMLADVIENEISTDISDNNLRQRSGRTDQCALPTSSNKKTGSISEPPQSIPFDHDKNLNIYSVMTDDFDENDIVELEHKIKLNNQKSERIEFDDDFELLAEQSISEEKYIKSAPTKLDLEVFDLTSSKKHLQEMNELKKKLNESYSTNAVKPSSFCNLPSTSNTSANAERKPKFIVDYLDENDTPLTKLLPDPEFPNDSSDNFQDSSPDALLLSEPFPPKKRPALVKTPARVIKILQKPKLKGDKWSVYAIVAAKGIELEVSFESAVIDKIFTISAKELISRREELISDPSMKQKVNETLKNSQQRFSTLSCIMVFSFKDAISKPIIVDIE